MRKRLPAQYINIEKTRIHISPEDIFKLLGEQQGMIDEHTARLVEEAISKCLEISSPAGAFVLTDALEFDSPDTLLIQGVQFDTGNIIPKMLRHSQSYAFFLVTAGPEPENLARSLLREGNYPEGYILDLVASALVDLAADQLQEQVRNLAVQEGMQITNRYSPGYCSWMVDEQQKLFSLFPEGCCGISLSESSLMDPVKSISGIIGMGDDVKYRDYTCEICSMKDCHFRRVRDQ
jgi:hypothetical protein